jgi:hypothetical protein
MNGTIYVKQLFRLECLILAKFLVRFVSDISPDIDNFKYAEFGDNVLRISLYYSELRQNRFFFNIS